MIHSPCVRRSALISLGSVCVGTVAVFGELSVEALVAVSATGVIVLSAALTRRAGEATEPVGRRGLPWLAWLAAALAWELLVLADDAQPTLSDLMDPVLVHPAPRAAATAVWLAAGVWLLARPARKDA